MKKMCSTQQQGSKNTERVSSSFSLFRALWTFNVEDLCGSEEDQTFNFNAVFIWMVRWISTHFFNLHLVRKKKKMAKLKSAANEEKNKLRTGRYLHAHVYVLVGDYRL